MKRGAWNNNLTLKLIHALRNKNMKHILIISLITSASLAALVQVTPLYENNLEKAELGKVPDVLLVLGGDFVVKGDGTN